MKIDRLLAITIMLLYKQRVTAKELSEKFEVSIRTIYRDIEAINNARIPGVSLQGNTGGFEILENYKIDRQVLTLQDINSILFALKCVSSTFNNKGLGSVYDKINSLVPDKEKQTVTNNFDQIAIDFSPWGYGDKQKAKLKNIHSAIIQNNLIRFTYHNTSAETTRRTVEVMTLLFKGSSWYLFAYCLLKKDIRLFRLSRIKKLINLNKDFIRKNISYDAYYANKKSEKDVEIVLRFSPENKHIIEDYYDEKNITIDDEGYLIVKVNYPENGWVYANILSYGENVEVIKPAHIRKIIKYKAQKILEKYQT